MFGPPTVVQQPTHSSDINVWSPWP